MATLDRFLSQGRQRSARQVHADEDDRSVASSVATELYYKMKQELDMNDAAETAAAAAEREEEERLKAQGYHSSQMKLIRTASGTPVYDRDAAKRAHADARASKSRQRSNRSLSPVRQHSQKNFGRSNRSGSSRSLSPTRPTARPAAGVSSSRSPTGRHRRCDTFQRDSGGSSSSRPAAVIPSRGTRDEDVPRGSSPVRRNYQDNDYGSSQHQRSENYDNIPGRGVGSQRNLHHSQQTSHERSYQPPQRNDCQSDTPPREPGRRGGGPSFSGSQHQRSHNLRCSVTETASISAPSFARGSGSTNHSHNTNSHHQESYCPPQQQHRQHQQSPPSYPQEQQQPNSRREMMSSLRDSAHSCVSDITEFTFGNYIDEGYAARPVPPMREQHAPAPSRQAQHPNEMMIEIQPGFSLPLRGAQETTRAVEINFVVLATCMVCTVQAKCIADAEYVLCPVCRSVSPIEANAGNNGGVGLGLEVN